MRDAGNLLTRAGFNIPSVDVDEVSVMYKDPDELVQHIRCATPCWSCGALVELLPAAKSTMSTRALMLKWVQTDVPYTILVLTLNYLIFATYHVGKLETVALALLVCKAAYLDARSAMQG